MLGGRRWRSEGDGRVQEGGRDDKEGSVHCNKNVVEKRRQHGGG